MYTFSTLVAASLTVAIPAVVAQTSSTTVSNPSASIDAGPVVGTSTQVAGSDVTVNQFLGIPFAEPPIGDLRFAPAVEIESWTEPYQATQQPPGCLSKTTPSVDPISELTNLIFNDPPAPSESEDCLYLNVYAPANATDLPVLFWIYGGSSESGAISMPLYEGSNLAANQEIIVVTSNYRITVFGQPRSPALPVEESNPGQLDLHLALDWVQRNIDAFGGDPSKVTIMGESAGAVSVANLMLAFAEDPPFRAAVQMSRPADGLDVVLGNTVNSWPELVGLMGCNSTSEEEELDCMREADGETIRDTVIESGLAFNDSTGRFIRGDFADIPLLTGYTADDASYFALLDESITIGGLAEFTDPAVDELYGEDGLLTQGLDSEIERVSLLLTDLAFRCQAGVTANLTSFFQDASVWEYEFNSTVPTNTLEDWPELGAYHAGEIQYLFGTYDQENATDIDVALSETMQQHFADFVKDPEAGPGWEPWPAIAAFNAQTGDSEVEVNEVANVDVLYPQCPIYNDYVYVHAAYEQVTEEDLAALEDAFAQAGAANGTTNEQSGPSSTSGEDEEGEDQESGAQRPWAGTSTAWMAATLLGVAAFF
jgi:carboxylesterase type B